MLLNLQTLRYNMYIIMCEILLLLCVYISTCTYYNSSYVYIHIHVCLTVTLIHLIHVNTHGMYINCMYNVSV